MTAETMMKRINSQRKEIIRYEKEIAYYHKEYCGKDSTEQMRAEGRKWIEYYQKHIARVEEKISKMSKEAERIATEEEKKQMIRDMAEYMEKNGIKHDGYTTNGLRYSIFHNQYGFTDRTKHCWQMSIEGKGTVFTSGTLETVCEYILNN